MKYYYPEHIDGYERVKAEGKTAWGELCDSKGFDDFSARAFLEAALPTLQFDTPQPMVLNYGCGTGPDACFLAEHGFRVDAVDLIPAAIEIAREQAALRGLDIQFAVQDICELPPEGKRYDMIVDSYCLQCIVFDADREQVLSTVRARLDPSGYYLISTAVMDAEHQALLHEDDAVVDEATGIVYTRYGGGLIDARTGVVLYPLDTQADLPDAKLVNGQWHLPRRRHLTPAQLDAELWRAGFKIIYRYPEHAGSIVCVVRA